MHPALIILPVLVAGSFVVGMTTIGQAKAEADARALQSQECRDVATAKYTAGDIIGAEAFEAALDECGALR